MDKKDDLPGKIEAFMAVTSAARENSDWRPIEHDLPDLWGRLLPKGRRNESGGGANEGGAEERAISERQAGDKNSASGKKNKR